MQTKILKIFSSRALEGARSKKENFDGNPRHDQTAAARSRAPHNPRRIGKVDEIGRRLAVCRRNPRRETQIKSNLISYMAKPALLERHAVP